MTKSPVQYWFILAKSQVFIDKEKAQLKLNEITQRQWLKCCLIKKERGCKFLNGGKLSYEFWDLTPNITDP